MPRKTYSKKNKTLSKKNIFTNKKASSQAKQINALNKKVNAVYKKVKPEMIIKDCSMLTQEFNHVKKWTNHHLIYKEYLLNNGKINYQIQGDHINPYSFTVYGCFTNRDVSHVDADGAVRAMPNIGYLRIIICKLGANAYYIPNDITKSFDATTETGQVDFGVINGPLIDNVTSNMKIVKNKVIKITPDKPCKMFKIKVKNPGMYRITPKTNASAIDSGEYIIYLQYYSPVLMYENNGGVISEVGPLQNLNMGIKFAFTNNYK